MIFQLLYTVFTRFPPFKGVGRRRRLDEAFDVISGVMLKGTNHPLPETHDGASLEDQTARGRCVSDLSDRRALWLEPLTGSKFLN